MTTNVDDPAFVACARCRVQAAVRLAEQRWWRVNPQDVTSVVGLKWVCADCWKLFVQEDVATIR